MTPGAALSPPPRGRPRGAPPLDRVQLSVTVSLGLAALLAARFFPFGVLPPFCLLRRLVGVPCPMCGMTRSWIHLAHGRVLDAVAQQPAGAVLFVLTVAYVLWGASRLAGAPWDLPTLGERAYLRARGAAVALLLGSWVWVWVRGVE